MDIQYLLALQELRNATGGIFDEIFNSFSKLDVELLIFIPLVIYWSMDKKWGYRFITTLNVSLFANNFLKMIVCAYRPWIRSDQIEPAGDSKTAATGYSFPSGHTTTATSVLGTVFVWQKDRKRWLAILSAVLILIIGFSRNFLGVHTPQDVVVGFLVSVVTIFVIGRAQDGLEGNEKMKDILTVVGLVLIVLCTVFLEFKSYPMDYVDDVLVVDPKSMIKDYFKSAGEFSGFLIGSYIERHYLKYVIPVGNKNLPLMTAIGVGLVYSWKKWFGPATVVLMFGDNWGTFVCRFLIGLFVILIWPYVIRRNCEG